MTLQRLISKVLGRSTVVSLAPLISRVSSVVAQWTLAVRLGPAATAIFVTCTSTGAALVAVVATGLTPALVRRRSASLSQAGVALAASSAALLAIAALLFGLVFGALSHAPTPALVTAAIFASTTVLYAATPFAASSLAEGGGLRRAVTTNLIICPILSTLLAFLGHTHLAVIAVGAGGTVYIVSLLRRQRRLRLVLRYSRMLFTTAASYSLMSVATAAVYPLSLHLGAKLVGATTVGIQTLYWSVFLLANTVSQSRAAHALSAGNPSAQRRWAPWAGWLTALLVLVWIGFRLRFGPAAAPVILPVCASVFLISDAYAFYFAPASSRVPVLLTTFVGAGVIAAGMSVRPVLISHLSVVGPSSFLALLRFVPMSAVSQTRRVAIAVLALAFALGTAAILLPTK